MFAENIQPISFQPLNLQVCKEIQLARMRRMCVFLFLFRRMWWIVFLAFSLKLRIQTLLSVAPTRSVFWRTKQFQYSCAYDAISHIKYNEVDELVYLIKGINTPSVKRQAAALKFWRLPWCLGMGLGPILERHNAFQWDLATWCAAWRSVWLWLKFEGLGHCKVTVPRPHLIVIHSMVL